MTSCISSNSSKITWVLSCSSSSLVTISDPCSQDDLLSLLPFWLWALAFNEWAISSSLCINPLPRCFRIPASCSDFDLSFSSWELKSDSICPLFKWSVSYAYAGAPVSNILDMLATWNNSFHNPVGSYSVEGHPSVLSITHARHIADSHSHFLDQSNVHIIALFP